MTKLLIPPAALDQHIILLGKTRSGKSSAMRVLVEHLLDEEKPVCIVDPKGDWWGLKASRDGKQAGYPVVIFGGEHADVPLNPRSGASVAELVATGNRSAIIDLGGWMPGDRTQFWIDFASTYFRNHKGRHFLAIDEVHNVAPKGKIIDPNAGKMLHWSNRLASEGLGKGISMIAASQRPQKVHNDFLTSCETLLAMRVIHKSDRDALKDWIDACGDPEKGKEVLTSVASLSRGEAWAYSPEYEFGPKRIHFPMFETYDSFKAQSVQQPAKLKGWADVNLDEVTKKLEAVVKEAEAKDPAKLQARVRELEKQLRTQPKAPVEAAPSVAKLRHEHGLLVTELRRAILDRDRFIDKLRVICARASNELVAAATHLLPSAPKVSAGEIQTKEGNASKQVMGAVTSFPARNSHPRPEIPYENNGDLSKRQLAILKAIAEFEAIGRTQISKWWIAARSGASYTSSAFTNNLGYLRSNGFLTYPVPDTAALTDKGRSAAGPVNVPTSSEEMLQSCLALLSTPQQKILQALYDAHPKSVEKTAIAEEAGASATSSAFTNNLGSLRSAGMIEYPEKGTAKAADWIFVE